MQTRDKILICYNAPVSVYENYSGKPKLDDGIQDDMSETAFANEIVHLETALKKVYDVTSVAIGKNISENIRLITEAAPSAIFNLVESVEGIAAYEAFHAGIYDLLQIPYTGNIPMCLGNCLDKFRTKQILHSSGLNVPSAMVYRPGDRIVEKNYNLRFPVITKLLSEDASIGISESSVVHDFASLRKQLLYLKKQYGQPVIIEEYIDGREFNIAILGNRVLPISEISFSGLPEGLPKIVTYEGKWIAESVYYKNTVPVCPAPITKTLQKELEVMAMQAYAVMGCRDYARVDVRLSPDNVPYVIEVNPNPDISSDAGFARAAAYAGLSFSDMLITIVEYALARRENNPVAEAC